jgi:hypothetical protein
MATSNWVRQLGAALKQNPDLGMLVMKPMNSAFGQRAIGAMVEAFGKGAIALGQPADALVLPSRTGFGVQYAYLECYVWRRTDRRSLDPASSTL